jgi:HEAT repeat protein
MSNLFFAVMKRLRPTLLKGELESCELELASEMRIVPRSPFDLAAELSITNDPAEAAEHFDRFFNRESKRFAIGAAYTEMNGFDINPDRWYCDLFSYDNDGGHDDYDWLSDWQSKPFDEYQITGLEPLQDVYASAAFRDKKNRDASYLSSLMVVVKFQRFMQRAASHMKLLRFPLYVTAHEFDFIASFDPRPESARTPVRRKSPRELTGEIISKLKDADPDVRFRAVGKLYSMGSAAKEAVASLIELLDDPHLPTRQIAATALGKIDPESGDVVSALVAKLKGDRQPYMKQAIVRALGNSPNKEAVRALASALSDEERDVRRYAAISLKLLGKQAKDAAPALRKFLEVETDEEMRSQATVALKLMSA